MYTLAVLRAGSSASTAKRNGAENDHDEPEGDDAGERDRLTAVTQGDDASADSEVGAEPDSVYAAKSEESGRASGRTVPSYLLRAINGTMRLKRCDHNCP